jgi:hypothetical protein
MNGSRKGVVLMLVIALLCSALQVSACLLTGHGAGQSLCCRGMAPDCPMRSMAMSSPCCQVHGQNAPVTPKTSFLPEHSQTVTFLPHPAHLESIRDSASLCRLGQSVSPPSTSPGRSCILRI